MSLRKDLLLTALTVAVTEVVTSSIGVLFAYLTKEEKTEEPVFTTDKEIMINGILYKVTWHEELQLFVVKGRVKK